MLTREYPPEVYGGAGVHVEFLTRELRHLVEVDVHCIGRPRPGADRPRRARPPLARCQPRARHLRRRPRDGRRRRWVRPRPLAHVVRQPGRPPGQAAVRHPPRGHVALARAVAAVEGRAARRRLRPVVVGRAHGLRGGRRGDRRQRGVQGRRPGRLPGARPGCGPRRPQRHRHRAVPPGARDRRAGPPRARSRPPDRVVRRPHHPPEGRGAPAARRARRRPPGATAAAGRRRRHAGAGGRDRRRRRRPAGRSRRRVPRRRAPAARRRPPGADPLDGVRLPVGVRAARHRQPGGHGVRHGGRGQRRRGHPRGRRRRRDRPARPLRPGRSRRLRGRPRRRP